MSEWSVPKGRRVCVGCEHAFEPEETLWSALRIDGAQVVREDRCPDCHSGKPAADPICQWKTVAPHPDRPKRTRLNTEAAGDLLKRLVTEGDPGHRALCYVLTLGLVRRRQLKITGSEPAPDPTPEQLEAERVWAEYVAARQAAEAAAAEAAAPEVDAIPVPPLEGEAEVEGEVSVEGEVEAEVEVTGEGAGEAEADEGPPRPAPRAIGVLVVHDRETDSDLRVLELALADDEIAEVTGELRELFQGEV